MTSVSSISSWVASGQWSTAPPTDRFNTGWTERTADQTTRTSDETDWTPTDISRYTITGSIYGGESQVCRYWTEAAGKGKWILFIVSSTAANVADTILKETVGRLAAESATPPFVGEALAVMPGQKPATGIAAEIARAPSRGALKLSELPEFLEYLYLLARDDKTQTASVRAIDYIDRLLNENLFGVCNELLRQADLSQMPSALRRAFLMVTRPVKDRLRAREEFYRKALDLLANERGADTAQRMLKSLA